jgi:ABC-type tungstate transport system permease subunit
MIQKMGWIEYSSVRGLYHNRLISNKKKSYNLFDSDEYVRYFIEFENRNEFFVIKELTKEEKQSSKNRYKFITTNQTNEDVSFIIKEFNSNEELFKLIIESEACNSDYERHFRLNKILK